MLRWLILVINREKDRSMGLLLYKKSNFYFTKKAFFSLHFEQNMEEEKRGKFGILPLLFSFFHFFY